MNPGRQAVLRPAWRLPAILVLVISIGSIFVSAVMPKAARLHASNEVIAASYFQVVAIAIWPILFALFWPRSLRTTDGRVWRYGGSIRLLARLGVAITSCVLLYWIGDAILAFLR